MNEKLTLQDLVDQLALKKGMTKKDAELFLKEFFSVLTDTLCTNESVKIKEFGSFKLTTVSRRESVDVNTGEKIEIPAHYRLSFQPDKELKELVNKPFASFESILLEDGEVRDDITFDVQNVDVSLSEDEDADLDMNEDEVILLDESESEIKTLSLVEDENDIIKEVAVDEIVVEPTIEPEDVSIPASVPDADVVEVIQKEIRVFPKGIRPKELKAHPDSVHLTPPFEYSYSTTLDTSEETKEGLASIKNIQPEAVPEDITDKTVLFVETSSNDISPIEVLSPPLLTELEEDGLSRNLLSENGEEAGAAAEELIEQPEANGDETEYNDVPEFYSYQPSFWTKLWRRLPLILFILIVLGGLTYAFLKLFDVKYDSNSLFGPKSNSVQAADSVSQEETSDSSSVLELDSVAGETAKRLDSLKRQNKEEPKVAVLLPKDHVPNVNKAEAKLLSQQPETAARHAGKETIRAGSTLRTLATRYYDQSVFWVYIYEENKSLIDDPDNIPLGLELKIPKAEKYGINPKDVNSVSIAREKELDIVRKARQKRFQQNLSN